MSILRKIRNFIWPKDQKILKRRGELALWALILALAYLPLPLGFVAWFAMFRPLMIISRLEGREAFGAAYFYSFMANLFQLYWVGYVTPPGMAAAIFILSLYPAVVLLGFSKLYRIKKLYGLIGLTILWVGMEYFRSLGETAFPWTDLAYSQGYYLSMIQSVSIIGCYGLSLILIALNILIWQVFENKNRLERRVSSGVAFLAVIIVVYVYGWAVIPPAIPDGDIRVSVLQGNVPLEIKWQQETREYNFHLYDTLSQIAAEKNPDLIVWPETAAPSYPRHEPGYRRLISEAVQKSGAKHLVGALDVVYTGEKRKSYNAAFQFNKEGRIESVYHKMNLVPFSERSPYRETLPFLTRDFIARYVNAVKTHEIQWWSDFYPGDSIVLFNVDSLQYSVLICYESAFPSFVRKAVVKGADFLANITNDTWFGKSPGPFQHMRLAVFRAVENRIWLVRCANTGISAFIDPYGREVERVGLYERAVLTRAIYPIEENSIFTKTGPIVGVICYWLTSLILIVLLFQWLWINLKNRFLNFARLPSEKWENSSH